MTLKTPAPAARTLDIQAMQTLHLNPTPAPAAIENLAGQRFQQGQCVGEIKEVMRAKDGWVLRIMAADDAFAQLFHARIVPKEDGRCLLRIDEVPRPYYTAAVRFILTHISCVLKE